VHVLAHGLIVSLSTGTTKHNTQSPSVSVSMSHPDPLSFNDFVSSRSSPSSPSLALSPTATLVALVAGLYALCYAFAALGYPVRRWAAMSLAAMRSRSPSPAASDDGLLGSLFSLNGDGLISKGMRALARAPSDVPPGLGNWDNSCYQNSIIQGLASLPSLHDWLRATTTEHPEFTPDTTNGALLDLIAKLNDPAKRGEHFWIKGKLKNMSTWTQQDAQEYYSRILDELDNEVKAATTNKRRSSVSWLEATKSLQDDKDSEKDKDTATTDSADTGDSADAPPQPKIAPNPLDGLLAQRVGCTTCGYSEGLSLIPFNCVTVSLGRNRSGYDIRECLDEYTSLEYIDGVECAKCTLLKLKTTLTPLAQAKPDSPFASRLQAAQEALDDEDFEDKTLIKTFNILKKNWMKSTKSKQAVVARAPKSLVLHVNRSIFDEMTGAQYKNNAGVSYPDVLDLGNWCLGNQPSGSQHPDMSLEEWPRDPNKSMLARGEILTDSPFQYRLRAAVTHFGTHGNGHYVCYRPHSKLVRASSGEGDKAETAKDGEDARKESNAEESNEQSVEENTQDSTEANQVLDAEEENKESKVEEESKEPVAEESREFVVKEDEEQWWRFSDDTVYAVPDEQAHQGNVFMLFYERIDESPPAQTQESLPAAETTVTATDAALPPANVALPSVEDADAVPIPPSDDADLGQAQSTVPPATAYPTPPPDTPQQSPKLSGTEPSDVPEAEAEADTEPATVPTSKISPLSPHTMRTAGDAAARGQGSRASLPMVSAT
jgi:ubiquitin carboxyl-terminal hydrolase 1